MIVRRGGKEMGGLGPNNELIIPASSCSGFPMAKTLIYLRKICKI